MRKYDNFQSVAILGKENSDLFLEYSPASGARIAIIRVKVHEEGSLILNIFPNRDDLDRLDLFLEVGRAASASVRILFHGRGTQRFICRTKQNHIGDEGRSQVEFRSVGEDAAAIHFRGEIDISEEIHGVFAEQRNYNLTFSDSVQIFTEPVMKVASCDSECIHGATAGGIDEDILTYFLMRGVSYESAKELYVAGFLA